VSARILQAEKVLLVKGIAFTGCGPFLARCGNELLLNRRFSGATGTLAQASVNSHIWPKTGQIWGTLVRGTERSAVYATERCLPYPGRFFFAVSPCSWRSAQDGPGLTVPLKTLLVYPTIHLRSKRHHHAAFSAGSLSITIRTGMERRLKAPPRPDAGCLLPFRRPPFLILIGPMGDPLSWANRTRVAIP
jgi:hypothetical protein